MKRRKPLQADPERVREWVEGSRAPLARGKGLKRAMGLVQREQRPMRRTERKRKASIPPALRQIALARSRHRCIVCGARARQLHHVLPERLFPQLAVEVDNLVGVCVGCHDEHERAHRRIPRDALPACVWRLVERAGEQARAFMERTYPAAGPSGDDERSTT